MLSGNENNGVLNMNAMVNNIKYKPGRDLEKN